MEENKKKIFLEFMKDEEGITANFTETQIQVSDILIGIAIIVKILKEETGKTDEEILKVVKQMIEEFEENNKEKGENKNGSKQ